MVAAWKLAVAVVAVYATVILLLSRNLWGDASSLEALSFGRRAGNAGKLDHWLRFEGACADRRSRGRSSRYVEIKVTGMDLCMQVCESMPTCMAFTLGDGLRCSVTTQCGTHAAGDGPADVTFVKKNVAAGAAVAEDDDALAPRAPKQHLEDCSYCPPQNQCYQPRICRAGRCFHGLPEKDGTACSDGDATTEGERCIKGRCTAFEDGFAVEDHSHMAHRALQAFNIHLQTQCLQEYVVAAMDYDAERCAKECLRAPGERCKAFSQETTDDKRCMLFDASTRCSSANAHWLSGTIKTPE